MNIKRFKSFLENNSTGDILKPEDRTIDNCDEFLNSLGINVSIGDEYPNSKYRIMRTFNYEADVELMYSFKDENDCKLLKNYLDSNNIEFEEMNSKGAMYPYQIILSRSTKEPS